jgi:competence protein ComEC
MGIKDYISSSCFNDYHRWTLWLPVFFGFGVTLYFSLSFEPNIGWACGSFVLSLLCFWKGNFHSVRFTFLLVGFLALGFSISFFRTHFLHTEMLHTSTPPMILSGTVSQVELKPTRKGTLFQRLILTEVHSDSLEKSPSKIRLSLKGKRERLWPGQVIRLKVKLSPISDPTLPGGFDFRRQAYFQGIGATGFALSIPEIQGEKISWSILLEKKREEITAYFLGSLSFPEGAIAAALITGDKAAIPENVRENFINSGLAHILAISGLHLTIIAGVVFMVFRRGLTLIPPLCLACNTKKIAAGGTIFMTFCYLVLSGFGIPAQRAFMMISLVMGAIMINRTALSMRTVSFAALLILILSPESLLTPSFQLSFAAVIGLIAGYETWKNPFTTWALQGGFLRKLCLYGGGLVFTSFLATLSTLPFTVYLFHRFSLHAIEANLIAVPLTSLVIMPAAFLTCLLSPLGCGESASWVFEKSIGLLVYIASTVSGWSGANISIAHPSLFSFSLIVIGGLWLCLWQQPWRKWAFLPLFIGIVSSFFNRPPDLLIDGRGKVVAFYQDQILYLSTLKRGKFTADTWEKHLNAKDKKLLPCEEGVCKATLHNIPVLVSLSKANQPCLKGAIHIHLEPRQKKCRETLLSLDWFDLWRRGSHAIWVSSDGLHIKTVRPLGGHRPWERKAISRKKITTNNS